MKDSTEALLKNYRERHAWFADAEPELRAALSALKTCYERGGKLLICGNGGSCADADHIVGEMVKAFRLPRPIDATLRGALEARGETETARNLQGGLSAISLGAHAALLTAIANDIGADYVYAQQVAAYGREGDVFLGISTSGNSRNVLLAGVVARARGMVTIGLTGRGGGRMRESFDVLLRAGADSTEDIQDIHSTLYHALCGALECEFWGE